MPTTDLIRRVTADTAQAGEAARFQRVEEFLCSSAVTAGDFVALDTDKTHQHRVQYVEQAGIVATGNPLAIGVALDTTTAAGQRVRVAVAGYVEGANVATATAAGDPIIVGGTVAGRAETAAATDTTPAVGVALEAGSSNTADVFLFGLFS